jgi:hypothetical protein
MSQQQKCSICGNEREPTTIVNQPKDLCFGCWFERDVASPDDTHPCGCPKERSITLLPKLQKGMIIFWITSTVIAVTLTVLYYLGIRP